MKLFSRTILSLVLAAPLVCTAESKVKDELQIDGCSLPFESIPMHKVEIVRNAPRGYDIEGTNEIIIHSDESSQQPFKYKFKGATNYAVDPHNRWLVFQSGVYSPSSYEWSDITFVNAEDNWDTSLSVVPAFGFSQSLKGIVPPARFEFAPQKALLLISGPARSARVINLATRKVSTKWGGSRFDVSSEITIPELISTDLLDLHSDTVVFTDDESILRTIIHKSGDKTYEFQVRFRILIDKNNRISLKKTSQTLNGLVVPLGIDFITKANEIFLDNPDSGYEVWTRDGRRHRITRRAADDSK